MAGAGLAYSQEFVRLWLSGRRRILEVGCGDAQLASWLATGGHEVTALDRHLSPEAAALARPGLRLVEGDFMTTDLEGAAPFDAIILVAVLHHLAPLDVAIARLRALLDDGGVLLVDDFDLDTPDDATAAFWSALPGLDVPHEGGPLERWKAYHRHDDEPPLHPAAAMEAAIGHAGFSVRSVSRVPYLFRYVDDEVSLLTAELGGIASGDLRATGFRLVAMG